MPIPRGHTYGFTHYVLCIFSTYLVPCHCPHIPCHAKKSPTAQNPQLIGVVNICFILKCKSGPLLFSFFVLVALSLVSIHISKLWSPPGHSETRGRSRFPLAAHQVLTMAMARDMFLVLTCHQKQTHILFFPFKFLDEYTFSLFCMTLDFSKFP
ncbi:hypothetical protein METSCH_B05830 [Metschnikowia aff. pulcherrima]|uniref:Uncharacterized protein n=1 Tax=Metschnikowia aff. pulcherrima TaxID=2163413 RepID=A0A4P6XNP0_9ASCO|nr:hypothetical protein METSCH_B05830 [Metschnikowia aff. pulcherrima]